MARLSRGEIVAVVASALALAGAAFALRRAVKHQGGGNALIARIRAEADPRHDVAVFVDDDPDLIDEVAPVPALTGTPPLNTLTGLRRMYVVSPDLPQLGPFEARLGAPAASLAPFARRWDLDGIGEIKMDLSLSLTDASVSVRREGGTIAGPCTRAGTNRLHCNSREDWTHISSEWHPMAGVPIRCIWAHPEAGGRLIFEVHNTPPARALIGIVGMDDGANPTSGAGVNEHVRFEPAGGGAAVEHDLLAPPRRGTTPYRIDLGGRSGNLSLTITTPHSGARWFCFSAFLTN